MENQIPNPEVIEDIYKNKVGSKSISNIKEMILNDHLKIEDDNAASNHALSPFSPREGKKRRQGLWFRNLPGKDDDKKEKNLSEIKDDNIDEEENIKIEENYFIKFINILKNYEASEIGCIVMLIVIGVSLCFYDIKLLLIPRKYRNIYCIIYYIFIFYYFFDFVFRMILLDKLYKTLYFWIDLISWVSMIFEIDSIGYDLIEKIMYKKSNDKYLSYIRQTRIEIVMNIIQIVGLLRVVKFYKLFVILLEENEKKKHINKMILKLSEKKNKFTRQRTVKHTKTSPPTNIKENIVNNNNTTTLPINQTPIPQTVDNLYKTPGKKFQARNSIFFLNSLNEENKKWEEDMRKHIRAHMAKQNKISKKVTEGISRLMMIIVILVFVVSIYTDEDNINTESFSYMLMCKFINKHVIKNNITNYKDVIEYVEWYLLTNIIPNYPVIQVEWNNNIVFRNYSMDLNFDNYHKRDILFVYPESNSSTIIIVSKRGISKTISIIYIIRLFYIIIIISALCLLINNDVYNLIFHPLEKIGKVVDIVSKDPVGSKTVTELKSNYQQGGNKKEDKFSVSYEIKVIQSAIIRISALMAINFGEAGGEILKENISSSEGLNPMLQGKKIQAIFGFCFIHNFSEINEAFQERTMIFVNQISDIVHSCVDKFNGITNKNLGDCYLLAWKFKEKTEKEKDKDKENDIKSDIMNSNLSNEKVEELADCALLGFLNIIKKINKSQNILAYRKDGDLIKKFGPKYTVQMGFGLHTGWGIEGAIGSYYKIDCSYLSPNVNIAARLETATNIYGVDILFSGEFYDLLSDFMKRKCRKIDIVTLKGSEKPVSLYTVDINRNIHPGKIISKKDRMTLTERRSYYALKKKKLWHKYLEQKSKISLGESYLKQSKGLRQLLKPTKSDMFYTCFEDGFNDYIDGEWKEAAQFLEKARYLDKSDGPTKTILSYIKSLNLKPPDNWDGYRVLTSKT